MSSAPPGWYNDPSDASAVRWWDGATWTPLSAARQPATRGWFASLPWLAWAIWLGVIAVTAFSSLTIANASGTSNPAAWALGGIGAIAVLSVAAGIHTLRGQRWVAALLFAGLLAATISLFVVLPAAPADSRACDQQTDCDTGLVFQVPFVALLSFPPSLALSSTGWAIARAKRRNDNERTP